MAPWGDTPKNPTHFRVPIPIHSTNFEVPVVWDEQKMLSVISTFLEACISGVFVSSENDTSNRAHGGGGTKGCKMAHLFGVQAQKRWFF